VSIIDARAMGVAVIAHGRCARANAQANASARDRSTDANVPARITGKANGMSVEQQIRAVARAKSLSASRELASAIGPTRKLNESKLAKASVGNERMNERARYDDELARRRKERAREERETSALKAHAGAGFAPLLIVDGYNVCGLEVDGLESANVAFRAGDLDSARVALTREIENFKSFAGYDVIVAFDADRNRNKDEDEIEGDAVSGIQVVYSVKNDADSWIEARVVQELQANASRVVYVATSDNALSSLVRGSGAYVVNAKAFVEELRRATQGEKEILQEMAIAARWNKGKKIAAVGVKDDDVKRKLMEMYKTAPNMEVAANAPKGDFKRLGQSEEFKAKVNPTAPKWAEMRAERRRSETD